MLKHFIYILESCDGKYYVGYTTDLSKRMDQHKNGKGSKFVRGFGFKKLLYHESYFSKSKALKREAELKCWSRAKKVALIAGDLAKSKCLGPKFNPQAISKVKSKDFTPLTLQGTKNCIPLKRKEAIRRGGVPCKVCGG